MSLRLGKVRVKSLTLDKISPSQVPTPLNDKFAIFNDANDGLAVMDENRVVTSLDAAGPVGVMKRTVTLNDEQIKALPSGGIEIIPAPGAGKMILAKVVLGDGDAMARLNWHGDYGNIDPAAVWFFYLGTENNIFAAYGLGSLDDFFAWTLDGPVWIFSSASATGVVEQPLNSVSDFEDKAVYLRIHNGPEGGIGNFSSGHADNTLEITVIYAVVDI